MKALVYQGSGTQAAQYGLQLEDVFFQIGKRRQRINAKIGKTKLTPFPGDPSERALHHVFIIDGKPPPPNPYPGCIVPYSLILNSVVSSPLHNFLWGKNINLQPQYHLANLRKAETFEKLSAERLALAKRVGIEGKVKAHTSIETAQTR